MRHARMTILGLVSLGAVIASPSVAPADETRDAVERLLTGWEYIPDKKALVRVGGENVEQILHSIIQQPSHRVLARTRALALVRLFPSKTTAALLLQVIKETAKAEKGLPTMNLQRALTSYAVVKGPAAFDLCRSFLTHKNQDVRYEAASAVRLSRSSQAEKVLQQRLPVEPSATVRYHLQRQIKQIRALRKKPALR